ncbi:MAG: hypothetical protein AAGA56_10295 [Myxococcota bacterium]
MRLRLGIGVMLLLVSGCSTDGALQQASISVNCNPGDEGCEGMGLSAPLARGSSVGLEAAVISPGAGTPTVHFESARPDIIAIDGNDVTGSSTGISALMLMSGNTVIDFVHLTVVEADALSFLLPERGRRLEVNTHFQLLVEDDLRIEILPERQSQRLLGAFDATWSVDGDAVVILDEGLPAERRLVATEPGLVNLTVEALDFTAQLTLEVVQ